MLAEGNDLRARDRLIFLQMTQKRSAGGQLEHPSEVNNSTTTGAVPAHRSDAVTRNRKMRILYCYSAKAKTSARFSSLRS